MILGDVSLVTSRRHSGFPGGDQHLVLVISNYAYDIRMFIATEAVGTTDLSASEEVDK